MPHEGNAVIVTIHGSDYDVSGFLDTHPGGRRILETYRGKDASRAFDASHSRAILDDLPPGVRRLGSTSVKPKERSQPSNGTHNTETVIALDAVVCVQDFIPIAKTKMSHDSWVYYSTGAEDEVTLRENVSAFKLFFLRPKICVDVSVVTCATTILGFPCAAPIFVSPTALQGLCHPEGETAVCRAAGAENVIQVIPTFSSRPLREITAARQRNQVQFLQLYVNSDRRITERLLREAAHLGIKGIFVTVDAPRAGRRERDMRVKADAARRETESASSLRPEAVGIISSSDAANVVAPSGGAVVKAIFSYIAPNVTWDDILWIKRIVPELKVVVKGVQRGDDAVKAVQCGCDGVMVSNHGGRQADTAPSGIDMLVDVTETLRRANLFDRAEVFVDGGVWRGTDVLKCLALGAKAVGVGRGVMYALAAYGEQGVQSAIRLYTEQLRNTMALVGAPTLEKITTDMVARRAGTELVHVNGSKL